MKPLYEFSIITDLNSIQILKHHLYRNYNKYTVYGILCMYRLILVRRFKSMYQISFLYNMMIHFPPKLLCCISELFILKLWFFRLIIFEWKGK